MVLTRSRPSLYLPAIVIIWGVMAALFSVIKTYQGLVIARFFLVCATLQASSRVPNAAPYRDSLR